MKSMEHLFRKSPQGLALLVTAVAMLGTVPSTQAALKINVDLPGEASPTFVYATGGDADLLNDTLTADVDVTLHVTDDAGHPLAGGAYDARLRFNATVANVATSYSPGSHTLAMDLFFAGSAVFEDADGNALLTARFGVDPEAPTASMRLLGSMAPTASNGFVWLIPGLLASSLDGGTDLFEFGSALADYGPLATDMPQVLLFRVLEIRAPNGSLATLGTSEAGTYYVSSDFAFNSTFAAETPLNFKTSVPEPATVSLLALSLTALLVRRGRRQA